MNTDLKRRSVNSSLAAPFRDATLETTTRDRGFTMLELLVVMTVIMIVTAISMPSFLRAIRTYQLNDAATQVAGVLKFTRYEAIRLNVASATPLKAQVRQTGTAPVISNVFTDSNNNGTVQSREGQIVLSGNVNLVAASTPPNTAGLATAVGVAALTNVSLTSGFIAFDQRGAITPAAINVLYIGNAALPNLGYRAIVLLPSGSVQIWTTDASGNWQQLN
jgi:prepilin-type N-terminal cleavage/methylation domain-containing protein